MDAAAGAGENVFRISFTASVADVDGNVESCEWFFDDGIRRLASPGTPGQDHVYERGGARWAKLVACDNRGAVAEARVDFVLNEAPIAAISPRIASGPAPLEVTFSAQDSLDDGSVTAYEWQLDGKTDPRADGATASYAFSTPGIHTVTLHVTDDRGIRSAPADAHVRALGAAASVPDVVSILAPSECETVTWTSAQGLRFEHVNVGRFPDPHLYWETHDDSPNVTRSGVFNDPPDRASAREYCGSSVQTGSLTVFYDIRFPGSYAGLFVWLNRDAADLLYVQAHPDEYTLNAQLKGTPRVAKLELKLPGVGWFYAYAKLVEGTGGWVDWSVPLGDMTYLKPWSATERMEFVLTLENRSSLNEEELAGTLSIGKVFLSRTAGGRASGPSG
jgi:hypothetical protein